jgi:hypothetical protein
MRPPSTLNQASSIMLLVCTAARSGAEQVPFVLVHEGKPACTIVVSKSPTPAARLASLELQLHVMQITGAELPICPEDRKVEGPRVLVGQSAATLALGIKGTDFSPQEYLIAFRPDTLILIGRDWEDTEANRREFGRSTTDETVASLRHRIDYFKMVGHLYLRIEEIACNPANYPVPYRPSAAVAWKHLGTAERMDELGALMAQAEVRAATDVEKRRVGLWRDAIWKWMYDGRAQFLAKP